MITIIQTGLGDCFFRFHCIRGDIQISSECTMAVPLPRGSPLTRPPILPPKFGPSCRIPPYAISVIILDRL